MKKIICMLMSAFACCGVIVAKSPVWPYATAFAQKNYVFNKHILKKGDAPFEFTNGIAVGVDFSLSSKDGESLAPLRFGYFIEWKDAPFYASKPAARTLQGIEFGASHRMAHFIITGFARMGTYGGSPWNLFPWAKTNELSGIFAFSLSYKIDLGPVECDPYVGIGAVPSQSIAPFAGLTMRGSY